MESPEDRHVLLAILAADAVGYSRLMSLDDRGTVDALDAARGIFRVHVSVNGGRVIDTAGDSVLAVFDSASGAVASAMAVQKQLWLVNGQIPVDRRLHFRIGVHLGDLLQRADGNVYGDGVNIAARLQALAEAGETIVSESVRAAVKGKLEVKFDDLGERQVKNIADSIRTYAIRAGGADKHFALAANEKPKHVELSLPDKPSIAVLAFANMSGDSDQEYFTDGITEDIITELARFQSLFVIARNSSFTYKGAAIDVKQVGKELGVRYVLEGSIRWAGNRIRVTAQLVDVSTGSHVWTERYDRKADDIFAVQDEVTECIVAAVAPQIDVVEAMRARHRPTSLSAYEMAVRGTRLLSDGYRSSNRGMIAQGLELARNALAIDPESVAALHAVAFAQFQNVALRSVDDRQAAWREGLEVVDRAIALEESGTGHALRACLISHAPAGGRWEEARVEAEIGYQLNAQDTMVIAIYAMTLTHTGKASNAIEVLERSLRINPRNPLVFDTYFELAQAYMMNKQYKFAVEWATRARVAAPRSALPHLLLAASYVGIGDLEKAKSSLADAQQFGTELVQKRLAKRASNLDSEFRQRYDTLLRIAAGLDGPDAANQFRIDHNG